MDAEFVKKLQEYTEAGEPFGVATVVKSEGSASARTGAKAIVSADGRLLYGWIGGGCADGLVAQATQESLRDGNPRLIEVDLSEDDPTGVGMPCGGFMTIYVEPAQAKPDLLILGHGRIAESLAKFGHLAGFAVRVCDGPAKPEDFPYAVSVTNNDPGYMETPVTPETFVVVTTQHKSDHLAMKRAIEGEAHYIGLVASKRRSEIIFDYLRNMGIGPERLQNVKAPCGLDLRGITPEEIALAIAAELVSLRRGGTGQSLMAVKGTRLEGTGAVVESMEACPVPGDAVRISQ